MADDKKGGGYNPYSKSPLILSKGLFTDTNEEFQPDGTYRFALNANLVTNIGEKGALANEEGNTQCIDLNDDEARVIGNCLLNDGRVVLFVYHSAHGIYPAHSAILIQNEDCTAEYLIRSECLGFEPTDVINCEYKIQNGCDIILYFTDRRTKYKSINVSKLENYVLESRTLANANTPVSGDFGWDCGLFNFNPDYNIPQIQLEQIEFGGRLRIGTYFVAIRYMDSSLNANNWSPLTNPIYVTFPTNTVDPMEISGGLLNPGALVDGAYITTKSIRLSITDLDTRYQYFQLAVLEYTQATASNNLTFISTPYNINGTDSSVLISELSPSNGFIATSSTVVTIPNEYIDVVRAHTQVDRRLIVGNLSNNVNDWSIFQRAANDVKSIYFTYEKVANLNRDACETEIINQIEFGGVKGAEFNQAEFLFDQKTYMRDEVYAFGIVYVFNDGKISPAFHIPGRPALSNIAGTDVDGTYSVTSWVTPFETFDVSVGRERWYFDYNDVWATGTGFNGYYDNYNAPVDGSWDRTIYTHNSTTPKPYIDYSTYNGFDGVAMANTIIDSSQNILSNSFCANDSEAERWEIVNTSIKFNTQKPEPTTPFDELQSLTADTLYSAGLCAYYESDTQYPNVLGCDGLPIFPYSIVDDEVVMHKIRHHKMPDARKECFYEGLGTDDANTLMSLKPLGMFFFDIATPVGYEDKIQGYYIVRGDRAGNKTVIDKGWLNVCDTTIGIKNTAIPPSINIITGIPSYKLDKTIQQNPAFMIPTDKFGSIELGVATSSDVFFKLMHATGSNYIEYFSPKSSFNDPVNLQGSYYKLENTIITTKIKEVEVNYKTGLNDSDPQWTVGNVCEEPEAWESKFTFRLWGYIEAYSLTLPRMFAVNEQGDFHLLQNVPILYSEYTLYNQNNIAANSYTLNNDNHRQTMMLSKLYNDQYGLVITDLSATTLNSMYKPLAYFTGDELGFIGIPDMLNPITLVNSATSDETITLGLLADNNVNTAKDINSLREEEVGHFYYAALKARIRPYSKLEDIDYIKASNQIQFLPTSPSLGSQFNKGGDCFITKQRLFKSFQRTTRDDVVDNTLEDGKLAGTVIVGYVESEINAHFRHKFNSDLNYYFRPIDSWQDSLKTAVEDVHLSETSLVDFIEHLYRYNLDYSVDNTTVKYGPLPDVFDYCSECSERFPHTFRYSEPSLSTQTPDNYKIFLTNSIQEIPTDTGEITNLFVKEQNLFVHTVSNLYRLNLAPQSLETSNDQIQVGSGTLANAVPQRLLDNANGYGRGGTEFEHSGAFCNDMYIWVDNKSKRVYGLSKGLEELSALGMSMWFRNNLNVTLRDQWKTITGTDYPYLNTSDRKCVGFIGSFDPYFDRYILHKKDYELSQTIIDTILLAPEPGFYIPGDYYWNENGLFMARNEDELQELNFENDEEIKNKSFTISFSLQDKTWASFHSYRPNHIWSNNLTFFSTINNALKADYIWKHNVRNYQTYYGVKHDFIYDYVAKGEEPIITKAFDSIEIMGNVYDYNTTTEQWREVFYSTFDRLHVYNNTQSSGLFGLFVKNPSAYYDISNDFITSRTLSVNRNRDVWKINNLLDYTANVLGGTETINTTNWLDLTYSDYFTTNENMGYIDYAINDNYINESKSVYELQRFRDKFLNVRLFYKPQEDYKIVINTMANLKRALL